MVLLGRFESSLVYLYALSLIFLGGNGECWSGGWVCSVFVGSVGGGICFYIVGLKY